MLIERLRILEINLFGEVQIVLGCLEIIMIIYGHEVTNSDHVLNDGMFQQQKNGVNY
jgi:hypothetical protein